MRFAHARAVLNHAAATHAHGQRPHSMSTTGRSNDTAKLYHANIGFSENRPSHNLRLRRRIVDHLPVARTVAAQSLNPAAGPAAQPNAARHVSQCRVFRTRARCILFLTQCASFLVLVIRHKYTVNAVRCPEYSRRARSTPAGVAVEINIPLPAARWPAQHGCAPQKNRAVRRVVLVNFRS